MREASSGLEKVVGTRATVRDWKNTDTLSAVSSHSTRLKWKLAQVPDTSAERPTWGLPARTRVKLEKSFNPKYYLRNTK